MTDTEKLQSENAKIFIFLQLFDNILNLDERLNQFLIIIGCNCFMFISNFKIAANETPLSIRLQINTETGIL